MAELILLRTIFRGRDHIDQLNQIFDVLGTPDPKIVNEICTPGLQKNPCLEPSIVIRIAFQ